MSDPKVGDRYYLDTPRGMQEITVMEVDGNDVWYLPGNVWLKHTAMRDLVTEAGERPWL